LEVLTDCRLEPALAAANSDDPVQFERQGYFCRDPDSAPGRLVFNRTVGLRDTWARVSGGEGAPAPGGTAGTAHRGTQWREPWRRGMPRPCPRLRHTAS